MHSVTEPSVWCWSPTPGTARLVERRLLQAILILVILHLATYPLRVGDPPAWPRSWWAIWGLGAEQGVGTWYAVLLLAFAGVLAAMVGSRDASTGAGGHRWWFALATLLVLASAEEILGLHEAVDHRIRGTSVAGGLTFPWILVGAPIVAILALVFMGFLRRLQAGVRWRIVWGGVVFAIGAVGFESLGGMLITRGGPRWETSMMMVAEEGLELLGAALVAAGACMELALGRKR